MTYFSRPWINGGKVSAPPGVVQQVRHGGSFYSANNFDGFGDNLKKGLVEADKVAKTWKKIFIFVAVPSILGTMWIAWHDHVREHSQPRPEYVELPYLAVRKKPFFWGDGNKSLFHNPSENWVPGVGYEKERGHH